MIFLANVRAPNVFIHKIEFIALKLYEWRLKFDIQFKPVHSNTQAHKHLNKHNNTSEHKYQVGKTQPR